VQGLYVQTEICLHFIPVFSGYFIFKSLILFGLTCKTDPGLAAAETTEADGGQGKEPDSAQKKWGQLYGADPD
jgi:hypothetical protein